MTIGIIGGTGWLGGAIARAWLESGAVGARELWLSNRSGRRDGFEAWPEVTITTDNRALVDRSKVVMLSVLPQDFGALEIDGRGRLVISLMVGVTIAAIAEATGAERIVRALPNAAAEYRLSYTPWFAAPAVTADDRALITRLCEACGSTDEVPLEAQIDDFATLTGSGPGFVAYVADAMIRHAEGRGIEPRIAERAVRQLFHGAGVMIAKAPQAPAETVQAFVDYGGTTAVGLRVMQASSLADDIAQGIEAARPLAATNTSKR